MRLLNENCDKTNRLVNGLSVDRATHRAAAGAMSEGARAGIRTRIFREELLPRRLRRMLHHRLGEMCCAWVSDIHPCGPVLESLSDPTDFWQVQHFPGTRRLNRQKRFPSRLWNSIRFR